MPKRFIFSTGNDKIVIEPGELDSILVTVIENDDCDFEENACIALDKPDVRRMIEHLQALL
jgi:hypothetical protein